MKVPAVRGTIERRLLVNYRVDPAVLREVLPEPFRPQLVNGSAIAGICLIRLSGIRPFFLPGSWGISSENAAHRIAVEWDSHGVTRQGVYIPRRDSSSRVNQIVGGRLFPGIHHAARFDVRETRSAFRVEMTSEDGEAHLLVDGVVATELPAGSAFASVSAASAFFERGALGYSPTDRSGVFDGLELRSREWHVEPLQVRSVRSDFFEDVSRFPAGSTAFDCALVMRDIAHEWHSAGRLSVDAVAPAA